MSTQHNLLPGADEFERMEIALFDRLERGHRRKIVTHRLAAAGIVVLLSGGTVAAATVASPLQQSATAHCYSAASTGGSPVDVSTAQVARVAADPSSTRSAAVRLQNALARCGAAWQAGVFSKDATIQHRIPKLQACISNSQVISVFPNRKGLSPAAFCDSVGLSTP